MTAMRGKGAALMFSYLVKKARLGRLALSPSIGRLCMHAQLVSVRCCCRDQVDCRLRTVQVEPRHINHMPGDALHCGDGASTGLFVFLH